MPSRRSLRVLLTVHLSYPNGSPPLHCERAKAGAVPAPPPPNALRSRRHADQYQPSRLRTEKFDIFANMTNF